MIVAWTTFIAICIVAACVMARGVYVDKDGECFEAMLGYAGVALLLAITASIPAQYLWGGGL